MSVVVIGAVLGTLLAWLIFMLIRNERVCGYRVRLLEHIYAANCADIHSGRSYEWRYRQFDVVSYSTMLWQFWRSFDSFYPDKSFAHADMQEKEVP